MNNASFTPGPWGVDENSICETDGPRTICFLPAGFSKVTDSLNGDTESSDTDRFNARLIAAAPDLLAACEWMLAALDAHNIYKRDDPGLMLGRNAITKAKGSES